jgi:hypothetical protein
MVASVMHTATIGIDEEGVGWTWANYWKRAPRGNARSGDKATFSISASFAIASIREVMRSPLPRLEWLRGLWEGKGRLCHLPRIA